MSCFDRVENVYHLVLLEKYRAPLYFVGTTSRTNCNNAKNVGDATRPKLFSVRYTFYDLLRSSLICCGLDFVI
jgi:hypothetical protein